MTSEIKSQPVHPQTSAVITTEKTTIACDGGQGGIGHPRVYLHIKSATKSVTCPYCGQVYVHKTD